MGELSVQTSNHVAGSPKQQEFTSGSSGGQTFMIRTPADLVPVRTLFLAYSPLPSPVSWRGGGGPGLPMVQGH